MLYSDGRCARCVLTPRLTDLLTGPDGTLSPELQQLIKMLSGAAHPTTILIWLRHSTSARLLVQLAGTGEPISHAVLDDLPPSKALHYIRDLLVTTEILPVRDEHLDRITGFANHLLADGPAGHAAIVKPYTHWYLVRRARHRSRNQPTTKSSAAGLRASVRAALLLLAWLDGHQLTLATLTQPHLEDWLAANPTRQRYLQPFIRWTNRRRLTQALAVPTAPRGEPHVFLTGQARTDQLRRCLHDDNMSVEDRVAGALVLLFGIPVSRLAQLTLDDVDCGRTGTRLRIGTHWLQLPPRLADLVTRLIQQPREVRSTLAKIAPNPWLFPGASPTRPASQSHLLSMVHRLGITVTAGRNTARAALATDLPASVLADLTGIHVQTAVAWTRLTGRDWADYVATRAHDTSATPGPSLQQ